MVTLLLILYPVSSVQLAKSNHFINSSYPFKGLVEDEREAATVAAPQKMMPKMPPGINVRRRTGPNTQAAAAAAAVAVGPAPAKRPKQQAAEPAVPRKQPQSAAAQGCNSMDIWELQVILLSFGGHFLVIFLPYFGHFLAIFG